jgi:hypothetical protein
MSFLLNIFKKDLMRLKWVLTCWLGLLCVQSFLGIGGAQIAADNLNLQIVVPELALLIKLLQGLMVIIIIPLLVQDDPVVGTTGFWFTRPIGRRPLLVTKGCFALCVLVLLPLIAELIVFVANGFLLKHILLAIPEILIDKLAFVMPFLLLAAITPKFSRYAIVGAIIFAGFIMLIILTGILGFLSPKFMHLTVYLSNRAAIRSYTLQLSLETARRILIILFGSGIIAYQYASRKTKKTIISAVLAFALLLVVNKFWRIDFIKPASPTLLKNIDANAIKFAIDSNHVVVADAPRFSKDDVREKTISAPVSISGLTRGEFAILTNLEPEIEFPDKYTLDSSYISQISIETLANAKFMDPLQAALGDSKILNPVGNQKDYQEIFRCSETSFNRYKNTKGTYKASARFDIYRYVIRATVPLKQGTREIFDSEQVVIFDILEQEGSVSVIAGEKRARLLFDRQMQKTNPYTTMERSFPRSVYLIENKKRGQAVVQESSDTAMMGFDELMSATSRLFSKAQRLDFVGAEIDKQWLNDAQLVRADAVRVGAVTKQIELEGFSLPEKSTVNAPEHNELEQSLRTQEEIRRRQMPADQ